jgi:putative peptidoglycan lipid II flippase
VLGERGYRVQTDETGLAEPAPPESPPGAVSGTPPGSTPGTPPGGTPAIAPGIARGALLIAGLTLLSRMLGLVRTLVFSQSVGAGCLGTAYVTANQVPNLIYELAIGGALTSAMVPVLARSAERSWTDPSQRARVAQITSALLTWAVVILVPLMLIIAASAQPIAELLIPANPNSACARADVVAVTRTMLVVFAPQVVLYGLSVVLFGLLQAYRRFTGPTLGPVIANLVIISSYLVFVPLDKGLPFGSTPLAAELVLAVGTTLNIGALVVTAVPPTWRLHLRLRPTLRFPPGVMRLAGGLAFVGVLEFLAMDLVGVVTIGLANGHGDTGALVMFNYVGMVFQAVLAVLAWSIVTSAFPVLSATDGDTFDRTCAGSTRAVLLVSALGTAVIAAVSVPAAHILAKQPDQVPQLIGGFALIAPGVIGGGVITNMSRVMFALGRLKVAAAGLAGAPLLQLVLSVAFVSVVPAHLVVAALSLANSVSLLVVAVPMVIATRRIRGAAAVRGVGHATFASLVAGAAGAAVGVAATLAVPVGRKVVDAGSGALAAIIAIAAFGVAAYLLDRGDLKSVARRAGGLTRFRP